MAKVIGVQDRIRVYEVLAQVLPVLFFALLVQYRYTALDLSQTHPKLQPYVPFLGLLTMLSIGFAEVAAINVIASGEVSTVERIGVRIGSEWPD